MRRLLLSLAILLTVAHGQGDVLPARPGLPILGTWVSSAHQPDGGTLHFYQTFAPDHSWVATSELTSPAGKVTRSRVWGTYTLVAADASAPGQYTLAVYPLDWAPHHRCIEHGACTTYPGMPASSETLTFPDPAHFQLTGHDTADFARLPHPAPATEASIPYTLMFTPTGEPSNAMPPIGLDSIPNAERFRHPACDELQQTRICLLNDGTLITTSSGCRQCVAPKP